MNGFKKTTADTPKQILFATKPIMSVGVVCGDTNVTAVAGKKIIKAGTPMVGNLEERNTAFTKVGSDDVANVVGVLMHDVDVTDGTGNGTLIIFGFINTEYLDADVKSLISGDVKSALKAKVTFLK